MPNVNLQIYSTGQKYIYTGSHNACVYIYDLVCILVTTALALYPCCIIGKTLFRYKITKKSTFHKKITLISLILNGNPPFFYLYPCFIFWGKIVDYDIFQAWVIRLQFSVFITHTMACLKGNTYHTEMNTFADST